MTADDAQRGECDSTAGLGYRMLVRQRDKVFQKVVIIT